MFRRIRSERDYCLEMDGPEETKIERKGTCPSKSVLPNIPKAEGRDGLGAHRTMTIIYSKVADARGRSSHISKPGQFSVSLFAPDSFAMMFCSDNGW
jgi:hypothetical protein